MTEGEEDLLTVAAVKTEATGDSTTREILTEVGALGLISYDKISRDVVIVPVNGAQCPNVAISIAQELNKIYGVAVVDWTVAVEKNLDVDKIKGHEFGGSGTKKFSKYTKDMRSVIKEFKREREFNRHTLYLFFIDDRSVSKSGFMPLASEFGFIFNFSSDPKLIAHELGHGKEFNLRHTFSDKAQHYFPERSTQNLMDYAGGTELWKYQWDLIHDPEKILFAWGQDKKEGAMVVESDLTEAVRLIRNIVCAKEKGESSISIDISGQLNITIGDLSTELGVGCPKGLSEKRILFNASSSGSQSNFSYSNLKLNVASVKEEKGQMVVSGQPSDFHFMVSPLEHENVEESFAFIKSLFDLTALDQPIPSNESTLDELKSYSICSLEKLKAFQRIAYFEQINQKSVFETWEILLIDMLTYFENETIRQDFYAQLKDKQHIIIDLYSKISKVNRERFVSKLTELSLLCTPEFKVTTSNYYLSGYFLTDIKCKVNGEKLNLWNVHNNSGVVTSWNTKNYAPFDYTGIIFEKAGEDEMISVPAIYTYWLADEKEQADLEKAINTLLTVADIYVSLRWISVKLARAKLIDDIPEVSKVFSLANAGTKWLDDLEAVLGTGSKIKIQGWIDDGLDVSKVKLSFAKASDRANLFNKLDNAKSIQHRKVLTDDYSVSGVTQGNYLSNSVDNINNDVVRNVANKEIKMYKNQGSTFIKNASLPTRNSIELVEDLGNGIQLIKVKPGTKMYRVFDGYKPWDDITRTGNTLPNGSYWTFDKPTQISDVIEGTAVMPEWNGMSKIIEIEVPSGGLYGWYGKAAKQPASSNTTNFYLKGGEEQVIISFGQNQQSIPSITKSITSAPWID